MAEHIHPCITDQRDLTDFLEEFRSTFDASPSPDLWAKLIVEETNEVREALANLLKEIADLAYVSEGYEQVGGDTREADKLVGYIPEWVFDVIEAIPRHVLEAALRRVHYSNMSKVGPDGKPIRRADGKILKGPNYQPPNLFDLVK